MLKSDFDKKIKELGLSRQKFSELTGVAYVTVSNWHDDKKPIPEWVEPFLAYFERARCYESLKDMVFDIEKIDKN